MSIFDESRAILLDQPEPEGYFVETYVPLQDALEEQVIHPQEHCLIATHDGLTLVLPTLALIYHHVAQGKHADLNWMVTFCALCNAGALFDAELNGMTLRFAAQGYYNTMTLIADEDTQSYWNHLTGACVTGERVGKQLTQLSSLLQMRAGDAANAFPDAQFTCMSLPDELIEISKQWDQYRLADNPDYGDLLNTGEVVDDRLPRNDIGLGIWTKDTKRYYSRKSLYAAHQVIIDELDGRTIVVCTDSGIGLATAFYCDTTQAKIYDGEVILDNDQIYTRGVLYRNGVPVQVERPKQNAIRWFGFSSIFPDCEVYGH